MTANRSFNRPYGTQRLLLPISPAVNCWATIRRPSGTKTWVTTSHGPAYGSASHGCPPVAKRGSSTAGIPPHTFVLPWRRTSRCRRSWAHRHDLVAQADSGDLLPLGRQQPMPAVDVARSTAEAARPSRQVMSTSRPPPARRPLHFSVLPNVGQRRQQVDVPFWLCSSISVMPEAPPKLPSIWNGGWVSNIFGMVLLAINSLSIRKAWSPSNSRAQKLTFHALLQPVPPSPRNSSDFFAAANSSGVAAVISWPGCRPQRCETWRC